MHSYRTEGEQKVKSYRAEKKKIVEQNKLTTTRETRDRAAGRNHRTSDTTI